MARLKFLIVAFDSLVMSQSLQLVKQAGAAAFYGASSLLIIMVNKAVLTSYGLVYLHYCITRARIGRMQLFSIISVVSHERCIGRITTLPVLLYVQP